MRPLVYALAGLTFAFAPTVSDASPLPRCRLDDAAETIVATTLWRAVSAYKASGIELPIDAVVVNPERPPVEERTLAAYIVRHAARDKVDARGCITVSGIAKEPLDEVSVQGGCVALAANRPEIRCSSQAVNVFSAVGARTGVENPSLLYLLGHELAHIQQRAIGAYAGRTASIALDQKADQKLLQMRDACNPVSVKREAEADTMSLQMLSSRLPEKPYRETVFSERGSLYWNIDQLASTSDAWQRASLELEFISQPPLHPSFVATVLPTPPKTIDRNAKRFVCDVIRKRRGVVLYPALSGAHPPPEQRLRRVAEVLKPIADSLPATGAQQEFQAVARLQRDLSPIFTHIYRETGVYLEELQKRICSRVNAPDPNRDCL